jgi:hypothetical protein
VAPPRRDSLEDNDFESLYDDDALNGVEDDPANQAGIGIEVAPVAEWFTPLRSERIVSLPADESRSMIMAPTWRPRQDSNLRPRDSEIICSGGWSSCWEVPVSCWDVSDRRLGSGLTSGISSR